MLASGIAPRGKSGPRWGAVWQTEQEQDEGLVKGLTDATIGTVGKMTADSTARVSWVIKIRYGASYIHIFKGLKKGRAEALFNDFVTTVQLYRQ